VAQYAPRKADRQVAHGFPGVAVSGFPEERRWFAGSRRPKRVIGDTGYGNVEARQQLEQRSISVLAPVHSSSPKDGTIAKDEFAIDLATDTVTCPRGKTAPIYKSRPRRPNAKLRPSRPRATGDRVARFARTTASPARFERVVRPAASGMSGSAAARTCAKPRCRRYPIPPSSII